MIKPSSSNFDPATDEGWLNEFAFVLRMRDVNGRDIGNAVAEVEAHLADSGQSALEAFGEPRTYADALGLASGSTPAPEVLKPIGAALAFVAGATLLVAGLFTWGGSAPLRVGFLVSLAGLVIFALVLRVLLQRTSGARMLRASLVASFLGLVLMAAPGIIWRQVAFELPAWLAVLVGAVSVVGAIIWFVGTVRSDRVIDPRRGAPRP